MIINQFSASKFDKQLAALCRAYQKPDTDTSIVCSAQPKPHEMAYMVAYRYDDSAICKYAYGFLEQDPEQRAFNLVAACFEPFDTPMVFKPGGAFSVAILPAGLCDKSDPLGQAGYISIRRKKQSTN